MPRGELYSPGTLDGYVHPLRPAHATGLTPLAHTLALQIIERLLCADLTGGRGREERVVRPGDAQRIQFRS